MRRTITAPVRETPARKYSFLKVMVAASSVLFLLGIWHRNYNLLGAFYDYSIPTSGVGYLHSGLMPYRDFTTPLQSLIFYVSYLAEMIFGPRYLALAYANLVVGFAFYYMLLRLLTPMLSFYSAVLIGTALCVCTFFQHGILWYNSIAMLLLIVTCLLAVKLANHGELGLRTVLKLSFLFFLSSMNKINFHLLGMAIVFLAFLIHWWRRKTKLKTAMRCLAVWFVSGVILGPLFEIMVNHTTVHDFVENIFVIPTGRGTELFNFLNPSLYLGSIQGFYPDNWSSGIYLFGFLMYFGCFYFTIWPSERGANTPPRPGRFFAKCCCFIALPMFFVASMLLTVTNMETEILTASFLLVGLICVYGLCVAGLSVPQQTVFSFAILALAGFFVIAGGASAFMHSRIRYWEPSWSSSMIEVVHKQRKLSALRGAVPFFPAKSISPELEPYFAGVKFTEPAKNRLTKIVAFMDDVHHNADASDIYWGPGLEILNRVYGNQPKVRLPLWYHIKVTVRNQDAPRIIGELERAKYQWIVAADSMGHVPDAVKEYITSNYERTENDDIVVYQLKHGAGEPK